MTADYGGGGANIGNFNQVYTVAGNISVPIYTGGRIHADIEQAQADLARREAEYEDLKGPRRLRRPRRMAGSERIGFQREGRASVTSRWRSGRSRSRRTGTRMASPTISKWCRPRKQSPSPARTTSRACFRSTWQ